MSETGNPLHEEHSRLRKALRRTLIFLALLWLIKTFESLFGLDLVHYGVYPRELSGLAGLVSGPLIHGSWSHLLSNSMPVIVLGTALLYGYPRSSAPVLITLWMGSGLGVWLFAREAFHIGASGLTFGTMFFLFVIDALRWDTRAIVLSMIVFFLYGSMIWGIFPTDPDISYESHFFGAVLGVALAVILKNRDPIPAGKHYSWEDEDPVEVRDPETIDDRTDREDDQLH